MPEITLSIPEEGYKISFEESVEFYEKTMEAKLND